MFNIGLHLAKLCGHVFDPVQLPNVVPQYKSPSVDALDWTCPGPNDAKRNKRCAHDAEIFVHQNTGQHVERPDWSVEFCE